MAGGRGCYLISYDVPEDKQRLKIAQLLEGYGERVQYSVFEVWATTDELDKLRKQLAHHVKTAGEARASVRIYPLCAACQGRRDVLGRGEPTDAPGLIIV